MTRIISGSVATVFVLLCLVGCGGSAAIKSQTLARANAACSRENAEIANLELHPAGDFSAASFTAIEHEVSTLTQLGLANRLHKAFSEVDAAIAADVNISPQTADEHLQSAKQAAEKLGLHCSFGAE